MYLRKMIEMEAEKVEKEIIILEERIAKAPAGSLRCHKNKNTFKWYVLDEDNRAKGTVGKVNKEKRIEGKGKSRKMKYLSKKTGRPLAEKLARKAYDKKKLVSLRKELKALKSYLRYSPSDHSPESRFLDEKSGFCELIIPGLPMINKELEEWKRETYQKNPNYTEKLRIRSADGTIVRSKSESMIASELSSNGIPYRYECIFVAEGQVLYPDFTIRHPMTGDCYIWEHFGMIEHDEYLDHALRKMKIYLRNGFIPGKNLIMTFETSQIPLGYDTVFKIIRDYLMESTPL